MLDRALDSFGPSGMAQVVEHHRHRENRSKRIGDPLPAMSGADP